MKPYNNGIKHHDKQSSVSATEVSDQVNTTAALARAEPTRALPSRWEGLFRFGGVSGAQAHTQRWMLSLEEVQDWVQAGEKLFACTCVNSSL